MTNTRNSKKSILFCNVQQLNYITNRKKIQTLIYTVYCMRKKIISKMLAVKNKACPNFMLNPFSRREAGT